jgi:hypothetical protein
MKFLIENYAGYESTQPLYFHKHINDYEQHSSVIRPNNMSVFDAFDVINPDVYIASAHTLSRDSVMYLRENKDKDIKLLICTDGLSVEEMQSLEDVLKKNEVNCHFYFNSSESNNSKRSRVVHIRSGVDLNLEPALKMDYRIQKALFVNKSSKIRNYQGTFHVVSINRQMKDSVDFCLPITMLSSIYSKYEEIIFTEISNSLPQYFFDAIYHGEKVYYDIVDEAKSKLADEIVGSVLKVGNGLNYNNPDKITDFTDLKKHIEEKHSSLNRTKTLLSQLPQKVKSDA